MKCHRAGLISVVILMLTDQAWGAPLTLQECLQKAKDSNPVLKSSSWDTRIAR